MNTSIDRRDSLSEAGRFADGVPALHSLASHAPLRVDDRRPNACLVTSPASHDVDSTCAGSASHYYPGDGEDLLLLSPPGHPEQAPAMFLSAPVVSLPTSSTHTPAQLGLESSVLPAARVDRTHMASIVDNVLYLGSFRDVNNADACAAAGIGAYLCVARECSVPAHAAAAGAPSLHLPLSDSAEERLAAHIPAAVAFIDAQAAAGRRVALFCQQGRSRSVSLAVAYVMRSLGGELRDSAAALEYVSSRYPRADPNFFFLRQLQE